MADQLIETLRVRCAKLNVQSDQAILYISVFLEELSRYNWDYNIRMALTRIVEFCTVPESLGNGIQAVRHDLDRELQRFHSCVASTSAQSPALAPEAAATASPDTLGSQPSFQLIQRRNLFPSVFPADPWSIQYSKDVNETTTPGFRSSVAERDNYRCVVTKYVDIAFEAKARTDEAITECEAAHLFPHGLKMAVRYLSRLAYSDEVMRILDFGHAVDTPVNAVFLRGSLHRRLFGIAWSIHHQDGIYRMKNVTTRKYADVVDGTVLTFGDPPPNPSLCNLHTLFAVVRHRLEQLSLFRAAEYQEANLGREGDTVYPMKVRDFVPDTAIPSLFI